MTAAAHPAAPPPLADLAPRWAGQASLVCLTGGTTTAPRRVAYDQARWRRSVEVKRQMLQAHGVGPGSRVAVCHPFDPWSIGGIHRDAALACGADVLPLGLSAGADAMLRVLMDFQPTLVCGSVGLLLRWWEEAARAPDCTPARPALIFHAGEPLRDLDRAACRRALGAEVINIYGMAQFDALACERAPGEGLLLAPQFEYRVRSKGRPYRLAEGLRGELVVGERTARGGVAWTPTRDKVQVLGFALRDSRLWPGAPLIEHLGRLDHVANLPDGSAISSAQVLATEACLQDEGVARLQVQVRRPLGASTEVRVLAARMPQRAPSLEVIRRRLLEVACDLADAEAHGAVRMAVEVVEEHDLQRNRRGKLPALLILDTPAALGAETAP